MSCSDCSIVIELRRQLGEAREEIAEWERLGVAVQADEDEENRLAVIRRRLGIGQVQARFLRLLLDRPGRLLTKAFAHQAMGLEDSSSNIISVHLCWIRKAMGCAQAPASIEAVWGQGWRISVAEAEALESWLAASDEPAPKVMTLRPPALPKPRADNDPCEDRDDDLPWLLSRVSAASVAAVLGWTVDRVERRRRELGVAA